MTSQIIATKSIINSSLIFLFLFLFTPKQHLYYSLQNNLLKKTFTSLTLLSCFRNLSLFESLQGFLITAAIYMNDTMYGFLYVDSFVEFMFKILIGDDHEN